jgi:DNA-binding Lrp family transcriptional regulator
MTLDKIDRAILGRLQRNGRMSNTELANAIGLSESACLRRVRALESAGVIEGYAALVSERQLGLGMNVFVSLTLDRQEQGGLQAFEAAIRRIPEVMECYLMTGEHDYLVRLVVANLEDFERVHRQHLTRLPHVARVHTSFAVRTVQKSAELPLR